MKFHFNALYAYLRDLVSLRDHMDTEEASNQIRNNVHFRGPNVYILFSAIIVASVGLNVNSIPVIIGAMLISPLMGPIIGFGMSIGINDTDLLKSSLRNLAVMVGISILASTLYFLITPLDLSHPTELLARTSPSIYDVFIALFGGFAGILETSKKEKGQVMSGVAIATALMPPLCTVGYGLAHLEWHYALGAMYLFSINSILIALAAYIGVKVMGYKSLPSDGNTNRRRVWSMGILVIVILVPSIITAINMVQDNNFQRSANTFIEKHHFIGNSYIYNTEIKGETIRFYLAGEKLEDEALHQFMDDALEAGFRSDQIILMDEATSDIRERLSDEDLLRQLIQSKDEQINAYKQLIEDLRNKVEQLQQSDTILTDSNAL